MTRLYVYNTYQPFINVKSRYKSGLGEIDSSEILGHISRLIENLLVRLVVFYAGDKALKRSRTEYKFDRVQLRRFKICSTYHCSA